MSDKNKGDWIVEFYDFFGKRMLPVLALDTMPGAVESANRMQAEIGASKWRLTKVVFWSDEILSEDWGIF
ncbi:MAG: hypothetical protein ABL933_15820 [Methyloglobulus sp.]